MDSIPSLYYSDAYADFWGYYSDELRRLDVKIQMLLGLSRPDRNESPLDPLRGLVVSEEEVAWLLRDSEPPKPDGEQWPDLHAQLRELERAMKRRLENAGSVFLPLPHVARQLRLSSFEQQCVLICLAPELDRKYEKLYAYIQDDVTCKYVTVDLVLSLLCREPREKLAARRFFAPGGKLHTYFFTAESESEPPGPLLSRALRLDARMVRFLTEGKLGDLSSPPVRRVDLPADLPPLLVGSQIQERMRRLAGTEGRSGGTAQLKNIFYIWGKAGAGKKLQVKHLCRFLRRTLLIADLATLASEPEPFAQELGQVLREAVLQRSALCFEHMECLLEEGGSAAKRLRLFLRRMADFPEAVFLLSDRRWKIPNDWRERVWIDIELPLPGDTERKRLWERLGSAYPVDAAVDWGAVAGKFRLTPGQIENALRMADFAAREAGQPIAAEHLHRACYAQVQHHLERKAQRIRAQVSWDDIILPPEQKEQLRNACSRMKYRQVVFGEWGFDRKLSYGKGVSLLFAGPPGTGKTMSAQVIARELQLELYRIDLSQVVSKYIGETEQNLHEIFREAESSHAILLFDEADALFGKRSEVKDAHDKYANIEIAYLLQKMEEYEGVTILTTNFLQNIDEAFMRRIGYVVKYPFPDAEYRELIWRSAFPPEAPLCANIDWKFVAKWQISGGNIKNIAVAAAFLAAESKEAIGMKHLVGAARHELTKSGKLLLKEDLGDYDDA